MTHCGYLWHVLHRILGRNAADLTRLPDGRGNRILSIERFWRTFLFASPAAIRDNACSVETSVSSLMPSTKNPLLGSSRNFSWPRVGSSKSLITCRPHCLCKAPSVEQIYCPNRYPSCCNAKNNEVLALHQPKCLMNN